MRKVPCLQLQTYAAIEEAVERRREHVDLSLFWPHVHGLQLFPVRQAEIHDKIELVEFDGSVCAKVQNQPQSPSLTGLYI